MPDLLAFALLTSAGLWLIAHRSTIADFLVGDGLLRQFGIEDREEKSHRTASSLSAGLLSYFQAYCALLVSGED
jgi:hypothetical protein